MWVVLVEWQNSAPTITGPFDSDSAADRWGDHNAEREPGVMRWRVFSMLSPLFTADGWRVADA